MFAEWDGHVALYHTSGIEQLHLPTPDFTSPDIQAVHSGVDFIARFAEQGRRVYCHCKAGRGRSATITLAWLIHSQGLNQSMPSSNGFIAALRSIANSHRVNP